jgi:hypothetical protein
LVWARTVGSPSDEDVWGLYSDGYNSSSDIVIDPTGNYISFSATTQDHSTGSQYVNNFTIQYPVDGSLLGTYGDFAITDSTADFVVTDHDFTVTDITSSATISELSLTVSTATLTASATTVGSGWTNFRQTMGDTGPASTPDQTWTFDTDGNLTLPTGGSIYGLDMIGGEGTNVQADQTTEQVYISSYNTSSFTSSVWTFSNTGTLTVPGDIQDANGSVIRVASTSTAPTRVDGQLWFNNIEGRLYIRDNDVWIDASPTVIPPPSTYLGDIEIDGSTLYINSSTLTINNSGTLLVNGTEVTAPTVNTYLQNLFYN